MFKAKRSRREVLDSLELFYGMSLTPDREHAVLTSASCSGSDYHPWCSLAHVGKSEGSLFWCPCQCHEETEREGK